MASTNVCATESDATRFSSDNTIVTPSASTEDPERHIDQWLMKNELYASCHGPWSGDIETFGSLRVTRMSDPRNGDIFLIVDKSKNRALASQDGNLHLEEIHSRDSEKPIPSSWQWLCTEKDGFKGFQNVDGGGFLGHDIRWDFYAKAPHHKGWEHFTLSRRPSGYYWIQALYWWTLWQVSARSDGRGVYAQSDGGTLWEFVKIDDMQVL
ncbi:hypothetical protein BGZ63DRAFT_397988 [Mariannaea sp. PMI_226]|nr:hypothetical protein BGZ63DRAFT_397988 [Mariannaea sp. PMI_226]